MILGFLLGSFDKFLLMSNSNQFESKIATFIRLLIKKKIKEPATFIPYLPYTNRTDSSKRKTPANVYRNIPSIYIPPESKVKDLSEMYYGTDYLETRQEAMRRKEIQLQVNIIFRIIIFHFYYILIICPISIYIFIMIISP